MRTIFPRTMVRAAWVLTTLAISGLVWVVAHGQASAGFCSSISCSPTLTDGNFIGTGKSGTVSLTMSANVVTIDVNLASAHQIVKTSFPGVVGSADNVGGGPTIGNFKTAGVPTPLYAGYGSSAPGCTAKVKDCHWAAFSYVNKAAPTSGSQEPRSLQELSLTISKDTSITDVHQLLQQFASNGQKGTPYIGVDGCVWNPTRRACSRAGLFAVTRIPEPASLAILASGFLLLGWLRWKRVI